MKPPDKLMFEKKYLIALILPLIIDQILARTVGVLDTIMVASAGESAVSGVSLVETINLLVISVFTALATGGAIVAGQYLGKDDLKNGSHAAKQLVTAITLFSSLVMVVCLLLNRPILSLLFGQIEPDVMHSAQDYFYLTALSFPFIALFGAAAALLRGMGNSKWAMVNALVMNVVNLVGNAVFIYGMELGAFGAGLSTLVSRAAAGVCMMWMLRSPKLPIRVRSYKLGDTDLPMIRRILKIGIPGGLENGLFQIGRLVLVGLVATLGTSAITANAVGFSIAGIAIVPGLALGLALTSVVAQCAGAGKIKQADYYISYLLKIAYLFMLGFNAAILALCHPILSLYQLQPDTLALTLPIVITHGVAATLLWPAAFSLPNAFRASGDVRFPMVISIGSMVVFRIAFAYLFVHAFHLGAMGVWLAMYIDWAVRTVLFVWRWRSGRWKDFRVI